MHNQGTTLAVHQRNSYLQTGQNVENTKEKEISVKMNEESSHAVDKSSRNPARVGSLQGRASVGPGPNQEYAGKASAPDLLFHALSIALRGEELQTGIICFS
jgi:hypothetical protein